nr:protein-lysine N-methyltransferase EEF2KMT-like isoform X1 [Cherax quadricarinatus]
MLVQDIQKISWQYFRMYPFQDILWQDLQRQLSLLSYEDLMSSQHHLLASTVQHPIAQKYPVTVAYTRSFLKTLISLLEASNCEVSEELYTAYTKLLSQSSLLHLSDYYYRTYSLGDADAITLKETSKLIYDGTTGLCTWEASHILAEWCCKESHHFKNKKILELGAGLGFLGLTVVQRCKPLSYTFTDKHPSVLTTLTENILINTTGKQSDLAQHDMEKIANLNYLVNDFTVLYTNIKIQVRRLDWERDSCDFDVDVVLAADVVYDCDVIIHLVKVLNYALRRKPGVVAYVACTIRNPDTYAFFKHTLASSGLVVASETHHQYQKSPSQPKMSVIILHISL